MKKWLENKPWKAWRTRKITFVYMLFVSTIAIIYGAVLNAMSIDAIAWLNLVLNFCKFVVGTGTVIILIPSVKDLANFISGKFTDSDSSDDKTSDDE